MTSMLPILNYDPDPPDLFWGTTGPHDADIVIVGESWGSEEKANHKPFQGQSGQELNRMLAEAGIARDSVLCTNLVNIQPVDNNVWTLFENGPPTVAGLTPGRHVVSGLRRLFRQLDSSPRRLIIATGNYPLWALTNVAGTSPNGKGNPRVPSGISNYRGSQLYRVRHAIDDRSSSSIPVLPIIHPAAILRQWSNRALTVHDLRTRVPLGLDGRWSRRAYRFDHRPSFERVVGQLSTWLYSKTPVVLAADIETKGNCLITCLGLADSADYAITIPFVMQDDARRLVSFWSRRDEITIRKMLCVLFTSPHVSWIGQNFLYDMQYIHAEYGVTPRLSHDTLIAQNLLLPGTPKDLGHLSSLYCSHHVYWKDDSKEWDTKGNLDQHLLYNCEDAARTFEIAEAQGRLLATTDLARHWPEELFKFNLAWRMMKRGLRIDIEARKTVGLQLVERILEMERILLRVVPQATIAGCGIKSAKPWLRSSAQTKWLLYELWGLPEQRDRRTKKPTVGKEALQTLADRFPRLRLFFESLRELRSLANIYSNAIEAQLEPDGRMRGSFNPAGTETFRWSSSQNGFRRGMNLQNIVAGGEDIVPEEEETDNDD